MSTSYELVRGTQLSCYTWLAPLTCSLIRDKIILEWAGPGFESVASEMAALPMVSHSQLVYTCHKILNVNLFYLHASVEINLCVNF